MADTLTVSKFNSALLPLFPEKRLRRYGMEDQPFWAWVPKKTDFYGRKGEVPIRYAPGGGTSPDFASAQEAKGGSSYTHFEVTRKRNYHLISIDAEALEASESDKGAYMNAKESEIDAGFTKLVQRLGADLQADGTGVVAVVQSTNLAATTFQVRDADLTKLEVGDRVQFAASPFTSVKTGTGPRGWALISKINAATNVITVDTTNGDPLTGANSIGVVAGDRVYFKGGFNLGISGTNAWIPSDRSNLSTAFNGVTRDVYEARLAGVYFDGTNYGLAEALERAFALGKKLGSNPDVVWMNYNRLQDLSLDLGAKVVREPVKVGAFAFDSIKMFAGGREIRILGDQNIQDDDCLAAKRDAWYFWSLKTAPRFLTKDTAQGAMLIEPAADGFEIRLGWRGELVCRSPLDNIRIKLPT